MKLKFEKQIKYLTKLTDETGLVEHCKYDQLDYVEGWCVDDNARALQVCLRYKLKKLDKLKIIYFNFLKSALQDNKFFSDLNKDLSWKKVIGIEGEHCGRALAALGETIKFDKNLEKESKRMFDQIYFGIKNNHCSFHVREVAQTILGLQYYRQDEITLWADKIIEKYNFEKENNWCWFEPRMTYDNGRLPMSLLIAYQQTKNQKYLEVGQESLDFLTKLIFNANKKCFSFPGNRGWFTKSGNRAKYDQQPVEAGSMVEVYVLAYQIIKNKKYKDMAIRAIEWYFGKNISGINMIDKKTGGVFDGLEKKRRVNLNRGAEAVLSYLIAVKEIEKLDN